VANLERALEPGAPLVHDDLDSNVASHLVQRKGDYAAAREKADLVIKRRIVIDRGAAGAMENRGIVAHWDEKSQHLTMWDTTQAPIPVRNGLARILGLSESQVRVIAPFVGGGFGPKIMMFLAEEVLVPWGAMQLDRPIKWADQMDRRPAGELFCHYPGTRADTRCRDRTHPRWAHFRSEPRIPA